MFWKLKTAFKQFIFRLKRPILPVRSHNWGEYDHQHICIAARLLNEKDFNSVCPVGGNCKIEIDDCCDACEYLKILRFNKRKDLMAGQIKYISLE